MGFYKFLLLISNITEGKGRGNCLWEQPQALPLWVHECKNSCDSSSDWLHHCYQHHGRQCCPRHGGCRKDRVALLCLCSWFSMTDLLVLIQPTKTFVSPVTVFSPLERRFLGIQYLTSFYKRTYFHAYMHQCRWRSLMILFRLCSTIKHPLARRLF